jgi:lysozyme
MTPEQLNAWRIIPRILMFAMIAMTYRTVEWFMSLPDPNPEQAALVSVMTGALTGAFGLFLGKKECETKAYQCSADVWTIGYGHTRGVREGDEITEDKAEYLLLEDLKHFEGYVDRLVEVSLNQDQFDALVSWTFNLGPTNLKESTLLEKLNAGHYEEVPAQMARWNRSNGEILEGLKRRRAAEGLLWQGLDWKDV